MTEDELRDVRERAMQSESAGLVDAMKELERRFPGRTIILITAPRIQTSDASLSLTYSSTDVPELSAPVIVAAAERVLDRLTPAKPRGDA